MAINILWRHYKEISNILDPCLSFIIDSLGIIKILDFRLKFHGNDVNIK